MLFNNYSQRIVLHFLLSVLIRFIICVVDTTHDSNQSLYKGDTEIVLFKFACLCVCVTRTFCYHAFFYPYCLRMCVVMWQSRYFSVHTRLVYKCTLQQIKYNISKLKFKLMIYAIVIQVKNKTITSVTTQYEQQSTDSWAACLEPWSHHVTARGQWGHSRVTDHRQWVEVRLTS